MEKDELLLKKRFLDLKRIADNRNSPAFTDFLNSSELGLLYSISSDLPEKSFQTFGGYEFAERQIAAFLPDALFAIHTDADWNFPITTLEIRPLSKKFAEALTHRDYLGAFMNLGIERSMLGDILVREEKTYVFCVSKMAAYFCDNLYQVRHTQVQVNICSDLDISFTPNFDIMNGSVSSLRLDAVLAFAFRKSRTFVQDGISSGKVFVNDRLMQNASYLLKENDMVSFRGNGKFIFESVGGQSKKGKIYITVKKFA